MSDETDDPVHFVQDLEERSNAATAGDVTTMVFGECPEKCF